MTDKADKGFEFTLDESVSADLDFEEAPVEEAIPEVVAEAPVPEVVVEPAPQSPLVAAEESAKAEAALYDMVAEARANAAPPADPLSQAEEEVAMVQKMIADARASAAKQRSVGGAYEKKAAILEERKKDTQKKVASLYTVGVWAGKPNYECTACPYATLDENLIKQHVTKHI